MQRWDIASGQLLRSQVTGQGEVLAATYGRRLIDFTKDGQIRLLNPDLLEPVCEISVSQARSRIVRVAGNEQLLAITTRSPDGKRNVVSVGWPDGRQLGEWPDAHDGRFSDDGRRLFVCLPGGAANSWTTEVYGVDGATLTRLHELEVSGRVIVISRDGNQVFIHRGAGIYELGNLESATYQAWTFPPRLGAPWAVYFADEGHRFCVTHESGTLATYDSATSALLSQKKMQGLSGPILDYAVSPDRRLIAGTTDYREVRVWSSTSGRCLARLPNHRPLRIALALMYVVWCVAWLTSSVNRVKPRPWLDVLVINGLPLIVLVVHIAPRPLWHIHPSVIAFCLALVTGLSGMLCIWWIHGRLRWSLRLAGVVAGLASIDATVLGAGHRQDPGVWNVILGSFSFVAMLALLLKLWRWRRWTIASDEDAMERASDSDDTRWQLPLRDALVVTAAVAVLLSVMRFAVPGARATMVLAYVSVHGIGLAVTVLAATWAAFSRRSLLLRWPAVGIVAGISGSIPGIAFSTSRIDPLWWCVMLHLTAGAAVLLSLHAFRLHGYRLRRIS